jgi:hypothetical protein
VEPLRVQFRRQPAVRSFDGDVLRLARFADEDGFTLPVTMVIASGRA